jgi:ankyrin repeat protein
MQILNAALIGATESSAEMHLQLAQQLLAAGAATDTWAPCGLSALMIASSLNKVDLMAALLHGSKTTMKGVMQGSETCKAALGADVHLADALGRTALMHAVAHDCLEAAELLVEHGAQVRSHVAVLLS